MRYFRVIATGNWIANADDSLVAMNTPSVSAENQIESLAAALEVAPQAIEAVELDLPPTGAVLALPLTPVPPAAPDFGLAMREAFIALETLAAGTTDTLLAKYPTFGLAMTAENGPLAWSRLAAALTALDITQQQHDAVAGALTANRIPTGA
jgi:hypothetical protein